MGQIITFITVTDISSCKVKHSPKKRKDSLETRVVLLIFSIELKISGLAVQGIHQNSEKWLLPVRIFLVEMTLRLF